MSPLPKPWPTVPISRENFNTPPRAYGILPFWFLNGELNLDEMRYQIREYADKGMPGIILHGRYGLEMPYVGEKYLERIKYAVDEATEQGLETWIYDEMNWPSGTADKRVLKSRPDLAERYIECITTDVHGPWFSYLTGEDSRYMDYERSTPLAAYAMSSEGAIIDLTPNLSFEKVIPWEAPAGQWKLIYLLEKRADYYIDAFDPEATAEFLRHGYDPYLDKLDGRMAHQTLGFYTDEPAMHYFLTAEDNPIVPWTKDMFRRFQERNRYNLRKWLPDLFFDLRPESARVRYDFYNTLTDFYTDAFYRQIHEWCEAHGVIFTGHLLYEEWLRKMIRVEGNLFRHYEHMDVIGVDHLYPIIGDQDLPDQHVAMKVGSSAAHHLGSPRLLCESFGGIFMDATMQRMKWIADWEYVLGVNLLNPHGFHYTLEGPRKRDWPPSMFYQYPWWQFYGEFSNYISRLSHLLSGGQHVAKVAMLWPINSMFATYTPQTRNLIGDRIEHDFNVLTDLFLRLHYDFDYLDEDILAGAKVQGGRIHVRDEVYELLVLPPLTHIKLSTLEKVEELVEQGGRLLGAILLPEHAFAGRDGDTEIIAIGSRLKQIFGVDPAERRENYRRTNGIGIHWNELPSGAKTAFLNSYAISRQVPGAMQAKLDQAGITENPNFQVDNQDGVKRYLLKTPGGEVEDLTEAVIAERQKVADTVEITLRSLVEPDVTIDSPEIFYLHRVVDGQDIYFFSNHTFKPISAKISIAGEASPVLWDPATGKERPIVPSEAVAGRTIFPLAFGPVGSFFVLAQPVRELQIVDTNLQFDSVTDDNLISGYGRVEEGFLVVRRGNERQRYEIAMSPPSEAMALDGKWDFSISGGNALVIDHWMSTAEKAGTDIQEYIRPADDRGSEWLPMVPGAWSYQLPAEPGVPYPIPVWFQIDFRAEVLPENLDLIIDGFSGSEWQLYVNGDLVTNPAVRSQLDAQMKAVDIRPHVQVGDNLISVRLVVTSPTDGILDLIKLCGDFSLAKNEAGDYQLAAKKGSLEPGSWTEQGYPFYSGLASYTCRFENPERFNGQRVFLEFDMRDDAVEVILNGQSAGKCLWPPYEVELTKYLKDGMNELQLRSANTLINLLEKTPRLSGLAQPARLVPHHEVKFTLEDHSKAAI